jgi:hypothetical protein
MNRRCAVLGFAVFASAGLNVAEAFGPSLKQTLQWLQQTISAKASSGGDGSCPAGGRGGIPCSWHYEPTAFSACDVSWVFTQNNPNELKDEITMPLWDYYSPTPFTRPGDGEVWVVVLQLKDYSSQKGLRKTVFSGTTPPRVTMQTQSRAEIYFGIPGADNKDTAERVARAFSRAIQLCQGKKPKNKGPF